MRVVIGYDCNHIAAPAYLNIPALAAGVLEVAGGVAAQGHVGQPEDAVVLALVGQRGEDGRAVAPGHDGQQGEAHVDPRVVRLVEKYC